MSAAQASTVSVAAALPVAMPAALVVNPRLSSWLRFSADGHVVVSTGKVEIGQGIVTALAQIAAEELDVSMARVRMASATTAGGPDEGITSGSRSVNEGGAAMRQACAYARQLLVAAAATRLGVDAAELRVIDGRFLHGDADAGLDYWQLPHAQLLDQTLNETTAVKPPIDYAIVGTRVDRFDVPRKVMGQPAFVHDMELPGMLFGRMVRSPAGDLHLESFEGDAVRTMPGVVALVRDGSFIGVLAEREEQAVKARDKAQTLARWKTSERFTDDTNVHDWLQTQPSIDKLILSKGDVPASIAQRLSARFTKPYIAHGRDGPVMRAGTF